MADIPLFSDIDIAKQHAEIFSTGSALGSSTMAPAYRSTNSSQAPLANNDVITIAKRQIRFLKARRATSEHPEHPATSPSCECAGRVCSSADSTKNASGLRLLTVIRASAPHQPYELATSVLRVRTRDIFIDSPLVVGRDPAHDLPLSEDSMVSRRHARLAPSGDGLEVSDEGSSNGTWLNGSRITRAVARPGDEITFGQSRFRLEAA